MKKKIYSWSLVLNWFLAWGFFNFLGAGSVPYFRDAVAAIYGYSTVTVLDMSTWSTILVSVIFLVLPRYLTKFGAKKILVIGAIIGAISYALTAVAGSPILLGILIGLNQLWAGLYCSISTMIMVSKWFPRTKGTIMGIITAAGIMSYGIFTPVFTKIMASSGVQNAMFLFAGLLLVYGIVSIFWLKDTPEEAGCLPDNKPMSDEERKMFTAAANVKTNWTYRNLLKTPKIWCIGIGWGLELAAFIIIGNTAIPHFMGMGIPMTRIVAVTSVVGILSCICSIVSGILDDKIGLIATTAIVFVLHALGMFGTGAAALLPVGLAFAFYLIPMSVGGACNNLPASQSLNVMGAAGYAKGYVLVQAMFSIKSIGFFVAARSLEATGGYTMALYIGGAMVIVGLILVIIGGKKRLPEPAAPVAEAVEK